MCLMERVPPVFPHSAPNPLNEYGKSKLDAENGVLAFPNSIVLRLPILSRSNWFVFLCVPAWLSLPALFVILVLLCNSANVAESGVLVLARSRFLRLLPSLPLLLSLTIMRVVSPHLLQILLVSCENFVKSFSWLMCIRMLLPSLLLLLALLHMMPRLERLFLAPPLVRVNLEGQLPVRFLLPQQLLLLQP